MLATVEERENWNASCDDGVDVVLSAIAVGKMVGDVGSHVQSSMDVFGDLQEAELDLGDEELAHGGGG